MLIVSVRHVMRRLLPVTFLLCNVAIGQDSGHPLQITVRDDDVTCVVSGKVMPCDDVKAYLLQTLHIAFDQPIIVSPEGVDPSHSRDRSLATTLSDAGFRKVWRIGFITAPNQGIRKVPGGAR
jgi:hypothetical protein